MAKLLSVRINKRKQRSFYRRGFFKFYSLINVPVDDRTKENVSALKDMEGGKAPGDNGILVDVLKDAVIEVQTRSAHWFSRSIYQERLFELLCNAIVILLHKKRYHNELNNDHLISLLEKYTSIYKIFPDISTKILDEKHPQEQE